MKIYVAHSNHFDFKNKIYTPIRSSSLNAEHEFILPHEDSTSKESKEIIKGSDLVVAEVSVASTGEGIEIGWASAFGVPVVCVYEEDSAVSKSLSYITKDFIAYSGTDDMIEKLSVFLKGL